MPQCWKDLVKHSDSGLLRLVIVDTCLGWMGVVGSPDELRQVIPPQQSKEAVLLRVSGNYHLIEETDGAPFGDLLQRLRCYLAGEVVEFPEKLDVRDATVFQQDVWGITRTIPYGETRSYGWVSSQLGYEGRAARAVGQALGRNPLLIVIPCHRVVSMGGGLGGFSAGLELKRYLLRLESVI